ncbi:MAG: FecR family protein [Tannerellaceae bacterium]|jgi:ferric-dicitrate binding protein FerR (iron transport regulator)|nr:FecR family protein [Tannerellaceae bacterium]
MNKYLPALVIKFFESNVSEELQHKFHRWFMESGSLSENREVMLDIWENHTAKSDEQTQQELKKMRKRIRAYENSCRASFYRRFARAAAILLLPILSATLAYYLKRDVVIVREPELVEYVVRAGERRHIILSDGSEVWVNSGSLLITEKDFTGATRRLFLNGEAHFSVAPNPDQPFVVKTEYMDITALGTTFNVQSYPDAGKTVTTLESGKVKIHTKRAATPSEVILSPNEQLVYNRITDELTTRQVNAGKNNQWIQGFMIFQSNSFEEIVQVIERKFQVRVQYASGKFKGRIFTVRFSPDEDLHQVFDILKDVGGFQYKIQDNIVYIM